MPQYLFVYGTLLPAHMPHELHALSSAWQAVGPGSMPGQLYDMGEYPAAVFDSTASGRVLGQVFALPDDAQLLMQLDRYEGYDPNEPENSLFIRERRPITLASGAVFDCWVYIVSRRPDMAPVVSGGDYSAWLSQRRKSSS